MPTDTLLALLVFAAVSSITPGPSNFMLLASGANFGFRRTVPQILGISAGFGSLLLGVGLGLGAVLTAIPALHLALKFAGAGYLLVLAWRIGSARAIGAGAAVPKPLTFAEAAAFQWVNPKAWVAAVSAMAVYVSATAPFVSVILVSAVFALAILPSLAAWTGCGLVIRDLLSDARRLRLFNLSMGALLAATLWPLLLQGP
ncbi:LysE family translocator [Neoroseomonas oryzicola]|uniref:LysE family translocator n=1 Tax=Neoroseomonas oryzicola TaxID=535904 RepID=A0A9X9WMG9_9PROT|nr:LysE family translocator [Neoroseomonas oryzicola]MBR0661529.1 LysE family translocator [Neoroseomonas oryzicola]NKE18413.1 LysE family translocator [Neoroseomonas oryzicola]